MSVKNLILNNRIRFLVPRFHLIKSLQRNLLEVKRFSWWVRILWIISFRTRARIFCERPSYLTQLTSRYDFWTSFDLRLKLILSPNGLIRIFLITRSPKFFRHENFENFKIEEKNEDGRKMTKQKECSKIRSKF